MCEALILALSIDKYVCPLPMKNMTASKHDIIMDRGQT